MADSDDEHSNAKIHQNQPYDESLDVPDAEEIASNYTPTPRAPQAASKSLKQGQPNRKGLSRGNTPPESSMSHNSDEEFSAGGGGGDGSVPVASTAATSGKPQQPQRLPQQQQQQKQPQGAMYTDDDEEEEEEDEEESSDEDDDDGNAHIEGAYDPSEYEHLPVTPEIKELFQYITRYTPQSIELDYKLKPFIPDFIPSVGDIDAFIKVTRPDGKPEQLGLYVLDEPCAKQSDPTVLDLQLRAISKQTNLKAMTVRSIEAAERNPKAIDTWINSISDLHRSKPPPNVHYAKPMPDIETLMQEWPSEFEELLKEVGLPAADMDADLSSYVDMICAVLDIPIYKSKVQSLHVLFTLYSEFKNSQHFKTLAEENKLDNSLKQGAPARHVSGDGNDDEATAAEGDDRLVL